MTEPVLANLNNYAVLIRTPEKGFISLKAGAAVAGLGFEMYIENRTLTHVAPDYPGRVVYSTPETFKPEPVIEKPKPVVEPTIIEDAAYAEVLQALSVPEPTIEVPTPPKTNFELKYGGRHLTIPGSFGIRKMKKEELTFLLEKLGLSTDGGRAQLVSRLSPLAGKSVEVRVK